MVNRLDAVSAWFDAGLARVDASFARLGATTPARGVLRGSTPVLGGACIQDGRFALPPSVNCTVNVDTEDNLYSLHIILNHIFMLYAAG